MNLSCSIHVPCSIFSALIGMTRCFHQVVFAEPGAAQYRVCCLESTVAGVVRRADVRLRTVGRGELLCSPSIGSHEAVEAKLHEAPVLPSIALGGVLECLQSVSSVGVSPRRKSSAAPRPWNFDWLPLDPVGPECEVCLHRGTLGVLPLQNKPIKHG